jgi:ATP-dependent Lon protease
VKDKVLAAHRAGIRTVILPRENEQDLDEIPADIRNDLRIVLADQMDAVLETALAQPQAEPAQQTEKEAASAAG